MEEASNILRLYPAEPKPWQIGDELKFADIVEFVHFEDQLPNYIDATSTEHWASRPDIRNQIRPHRFNGRLTDVALVVVDPVNMNIADYGKSKQWLSIDGKPRSTLIPDTQLELSERTVIFDFFARAVSSGRGQIGTIASTLVYRPRPLAGVKDFKSSFSGYPYGIRRNIAHPEIIGSESFESLTAKSIQIAHHVNRFALRRPISTPMGQ